MEFDRLSFTVQERYRIQINVPDIKPIKNRDDFIKKLMLINGVHDVKFYSISEYYIYAADTKSPYEYMTEIKKIFNQPENN